MEPLRTSRFVGVSFFYTTTASTPRLSTRVDNRDPDQRQRSVEIKIIERANFFFKFP